MTNTASFASTTLSILQPKQKPFTLTSFKPQAPQIHPAIGISRPKCFKKFSAIVAVRSTQKNYVGGHVIGGKESFDKWSSPNHSHTLFCLVLGVNVPYTPSSIRKEASNHILTVVLAKVTDDVAETSSGQLLVDAWIFDSNKLNSLERQQIVTSLLNERLKDIDETMQVREAIVATLLPPQEFFTLISREKQLKVGRGICYTYATAIFKLLDALCAAKTDSHGSKLLEGFCTINHPATNGKLKRTVFFSETLREDEKEVVLRWMLGLSLARSTSSEHVLIKLIQEAEAVQDDFNENACDLSFTKNLKQAIENVLSQPQRAYLQCPEWKENAELLRLVPDAFMCLVHPAWTILTFVLVMAQVLLITLWALRTYRKGKPVLYKCILWGAIVSSTIIIHYFRRQLSLTLTLVVFETCLAILILLKDT